MRESVGQAFIVNLIIVLIVVFIFLFAGSTAYTKAYKVKNQIINIIEEHNGNYGDSTSDIGVYLSNVGYRRGGSGSCPRGMARQKGLGYCYQKIEEEENRTYYYKITTFMYFEFPLISGALQIPVSGETRVFNRF